MEVGKNMPKFGEWTTVEAMLEGGLCFERARGYRLAEERRMQSDYLNEEEDLT
jgi:hypothetical protein